MEERPGYGVAIRRGIMEAQGDYIIIAEPGRTFSGMDIAKFLAYSDDSDFIVGTRTNKALIRGGENMRAFMRWGNLAVAKLLQILYNGPSLSDCGCTLRMIHRSALEKFQSQLTVGQSHFLPEMVILALRHHLRVIEIPVNYRGRVGDSKITCNFKGALRTGLQMIWLILSYKFKQVPSNSADQPLKPGRHRNA